jgi:hypothetical protein
LDNATLDFAAITEANGEGLAAIRIAGLAAPARLCGLNFLPETDQ